MILKDFSKLETFLTVVKERSFSKASAKLGISQPAVTQQIKFLEEYLDTKLVERRKNGIKLTKDGEEVYKIILKIEKCNLNAEGSFFKIINKETTFVIGASFTIANYLIPYVLNDIKEAINNDILIKAEVNEKVVREVLDKRFDIGLISAPIFKEGLVYREWYDDELVLFSNTPLPKCVKKDDLYKFNWICREQGSNTRKVITDLFEKIGIDCKNLHVLGEVTSSTTVVQAVLKSQSDKNKPVVSIVSKFAIEHEVENKKLYEARIKGYKIKRKLYLVYLKERKHDAFIEKIAEFLLRLKKK